MASCETKACEVQEKENSLSLGLILVNFYIDVSAIFNFNKSGEILSFTLRIFLQLCLEYVKSISLRCWKSLETSCRYVQCVCINVSIKQSSSTGLWIVRCQVHISC